MGEQESHALAVAVQEWRASADKAWAEFFLELFKALAKAR